MTKRHERPFVKITNKFIGVKVKNQKNLSHVFLYFSIFNFVFRMTDRPKDIVNYAMNAYWLSESSQKNLKPLILKSI